MKVRRRVVLHHPQALLFGIGGGHIAVEVYQDLAPGSLLLLVEEASAVGVDGGEEAPD